jgi:micrococcal nuclease
MPYPSSRAFWLVILTLACGGSATAQVVPGLPPRPTCRVSRVIDGDTFTCSGGRRVRLLSIDAPEVAQRPAGDSSKAALQRLIHRDVEVSLELGRDSLDRYGRTLAFVWLPDGRLVNEELVQRGWAVVYLYDRKNLQHADRLQAAEDSARTNDRGWWRNGAIDCRPKAYRDRLCGRSPR